MARTRRFAADILGRAGNRIFSMLSRWEERGRLAGAARWLKLTLLGFFITLITSLALQAREPEVTCYIVARLPEVMFTDVSVSPNPTAGADSVTVKASAKVFDTTLKDNYISGAWLLRQKDTTRILLKALDGGFSDTLEMLEGRVYVGDLDTGLSWISLVVTTSQGALESYFMEFDVSDYVPQDSTEDKGE